MLLTSLHNIFLFVCVVHIAYGLRTAPRNRKRDLPNDTDELTTIPNKTRVILPSCKSRIYCESELLHDVQMARIYPDSKTFVDMKLKYAESDIIAKYKTLKDKYGGRVPPNAELKKFVDENLEASDELVEWRLPDFNDNPSIVSRVRNPVYKQWAVSLNLVWKTLARKVKDDVRTDPDKYSMIWVPNGFIIPGGRFKELYYWDTYWIVNGLLLCDMKDTARGVIDNIVSMVRKYGFMPNGGRVYYLSRSQPPMLVLMVLSYYEATNDFDYVKRVIGDLESEFNFWIKNRTFEFRKNEKPYKMARYSAVSGGPRPESYREDYETGEYFVNETNKEKFYEEIKSGVETGWDFSSRWFITANGTNRGKMTDIHTQQIIPVDLNSILQKNAALLGTWFGRMGNELKADHYNRIAEEYLTNIHEVLWREDRGVWFDWDLTNHKHREYFYASNIVPMWTESHAMQTEAVANAVIKYLQDQSIIGHDYNVCYKGLPASLYYSTQQWDYSNAWPPLQAFIIQGLFKTKNLMAKYVAQKLTKVWLNTNYKGFEKDSAMYEKYDVLAEGESGGGGEYEAQTGFGWTNGVVFELLNQLNESTIHLNENTTNDQENTNNCTKPIKEV